MTRKKRDAEDVYELDDWDPEEESHRKDGLRRHRGGRKADREPFDTNEAPWTQLNRKRGKSND